MNKTLIAITISIVVSLTGCSSELTADQVDISRATESCQHKSGVFHIKVHTLGQAEATCRNGEVFPLRGSAYLAPQGPSK